MKLLIHTCCADCLLKMVDSLKDKTAEITAYFYNPNIHPRAEYLSRLKAIKQITKENKIKLVVADWSPKEWFRGVERDTLKPKRCDKCWKLRLNRTFDYAKKNNFEVVSTTLLSSHYQNKDKIIEIGKNFEKEFGIKFLVLKQISKDLKTTGFYKQNYCGCCYSLIEAWEEKFKT